MGVKRKSVAVKDEEEVDLDEGVEEKEEVADTENKGDKKKDAKDTVENKDEEDGEKDEFDDDAEPIIPIRKSNASFIIGRQKNKIKKLESKTDKDEEADDTEVETDEDDSDNGISDGAKKVIDKAVDEKIKPLIKSIVSKADEDELKELISSDPDAKKYEKHIRAYMGHEAYKGVPPEFIYHHLAFKNAQALGAKKRNAADLESKQTKSGGKATVKDKGELGGLPSAEDIENMSEKEFEALQHKATTGGFVKK